jgi:hypothetical protein
MKLHDLIKRVDELIAIGEKTLETTSSSEFGSSVETSQYRLFRSASLSFLLKSFGANHPYYNEFDDQVAADKQPDRVKAGLGVLRAVKNEMEGGWSISVKTLISAEIFSDFLEMAFYLLTEDYKDAAAVMIGSTLEEHLRQLCQNASIPLDITKPSGEMIAKKADTLNADLVKESVYNHLDQKNITAWLDLRNKAAHGKYNEYAKEQVQLMYQGVLDFMARISS